MRSRSDDQTVRRPVFESGAYYKVDSLAITANQILFEGMPPILHYDPASTGRNLTLYTPAVPSLSQDLEIVNISAGTGILTILDPTGAITLGTLAPGQRGWLYWVPKTAAWQVFTGTVLGSGTVAGQQVLTQYTKLADLANTNNISMTVPFAFKLLSIGFRVRVPATTAAKLATLQAQINGVACTGGAVSLTSANCTPTKNLVAGTSITALNIGSAGQTVEALISAVTAFLEGDGNVEWTVQNTSLLA